MVTGRERRSPSPPRPSSGVTSSPIAFQWSSRSTRSRSTRPTRSLNRATPSDAMITRTSSASSVKKRMTCSGLPANRSRSTGSCVAIPTGHVFRWQTRIMMQPIAISGAVEAPISSAPSSAAITTSRPVRIPPSACSTTRERSPLRTSVCCVSASPSSHGTPACWSEDCGDAPVPPSNPAMTMWSACAFTTPAATVPTPASAASFTEMRADGFAQRRSWMSCLRSSIE